MRLLLTRPQEDAAETAAVLRDQGHEVLIEPLLSITAVTGAELDLSDVQALLITSRNGLRAFVDRCPRRDLPVYAVGPSSATAARDAGFATVRSANGDADALAALVRSQLDPAAGPLLHPSGRDTAGDLSNGLRAAGFSLRRAVLYRAEAADALGIEARTALAERTLDGVLFFSPRTAGIFASLAVRADVARACGTLTAFCLSPAVATAVDSLPWRDVRVADAPNQPAMLAQVAAAAADKRAADNAAADNEEVEMADGKDSDTQAEQTTATATDPVDPDVSEGANPAERIIARFGGLRPMAGKLDIAVSTVQGWKQRGHIPEARHRDILDAARAHGIALDEAELAAAGSAVERPGVPADAPVDTAAEAAAEAAAERTAEAADDETADSAAAAQTDDDEPPAAAPPPPAAPARRGGGAFLTGLLIGGALLLGGAAAAIYARGYWMPYLEAAPTAKIAAMEGRLAALEQRSAPADPTAALTDLRGDLDTFGTRLSELESQTAAATAGPDEAALTALADQVAALGRRLDELASAATQPANGALAAVRDDLAALTARVDAAAASATAAAPSDEAVQVLSGELAELQARSETLQGEIAELAALREQLAGLRQDLGAAEARLAAAEQGGGELGARLDTAERRLGGLAESTAAVGSGTGRSLGLVLALGQLSEALRGAGPYAEELALMTRMVGDDPALQATLAPLVAQAERGVATLGMLRDDFPAVADAVAAAAVGGPEVGLWERVKQEAAKIVVVRRVDDSGGSDLDALLARAEARLGDADLAGAVAALQGLSDAPAAAAGDWLARAQARLDADAALAALTRQAASDLLPQEG